MSGKGFALLQMTEVRSAVPSAKLKTFFEFRRDFFGPRTWLRTTLDRILPAPSGQTKLTILFPGW